MKSIKPVLVLFLQYVLTAFAGLLGPSFAKLALTGAAGVNTDLFATMVFGPALFLLLGYWRGPRVFALHALFLWAATAAAFFNGSEKQILAPGRNCIQPSLVGCSLRLWGHFSNTLFRKTTVIKNYPNNCGID